MSANVISGLAAALQGGMKAYNTQRATDEEKRQFDVEQARQQQLLARMISRDELDEFKAREDVADKQFDRAITTAQQFGGQKVPQSAIASLPAHLRDLISKPAEQTLASKSFTGYSETAGQPQDGAITIEDRKAVGPGMVDITMPESEKARIAQANQLAAFQRAQLLSGGRDAQRELQNKQFYDKLAQDRELGNQRINATLAGIAARGQSGGRGSTKIVTGSDENGRPVSYLVDSDTGDIIRSYDKPLTNQERTAQTNSAASMDTINDIARLYKDEYVGPLQGRATSFSNTYGVGTPWSANTPETAEFSAAVSRYKNKMINKITGAAVGVQEEKRIMGEIPDVNDPPTTFKAKLKLSQDNERLLDSAIAKRTGVRAGASPAPGAQGVPPSAATKKPYEIVSVK